MLTTFIGLAAAAGTTFSYVPQLLKVWRTGEAGDVSLRMLLVLFAGVLLWTVYGVRQRDVVIIVSNATSLVFLTAIIVLKLARSRSASPDDRSEPT